MFNELDNELTSILDKLDKFKGKDVLSEADTKGILIEPLLQTLGWSVSNFEDVQRERKVSDDGFVDYALKVLGVPEIFIEAEALDTDLSAPELIEQVVKRATIEDSLKLCLLTNGNEYRLYKVDENELDPADRMVFGVSIEECKDDDKKLNFVEMMQRLTKNNVESGELNRWIGQSFVENRIRNIITTPTDEFLDFMKDQIGVNVSNKQIQAAIEKLMEKKIVIKKPENKNGEPTWWDGKKRHLEERCSAKTKEWLERIIVIIREITGMNEPIWNPKDYVAYKNNNRIWLSIATHKDKLSLHFGPLAKSFSAKKAAERLGITFFEMTDSKIEKIPKGSSIVIEKSKSPGKDRIVLRIEENFELEKEEFKNVLQEAYKVFQEVG